MVYHRSDRVVVEKPGHFAWIAHGPRERVGWDWRGPLGALLQDRPRKRPRFYSVADNPLPFLRCRPLIHGVVRGLTRPFT